VAREVVYTDDLSGERDAEPVRFGWNETWFEIDLAEENRSKLEEFLETYINAGRPVQGPHGGEAEAPRRRGRQPRAASASEDKIDYTSPEHAGTLHRGRIMEAEAEWVRNNLDAANGNRTRAGQPLIDPSDEKEKRRYGFTAQRSSTPVFSSSDQ
jgi:hypothetical protein